MRFLLISSLFILFALYAISDGNWFTRGSPMDLSNPQTSERYAVDPTPEDVAFLETLPNLSPTCYDEPKGCQVMDLDLFRALNPLPDFWLYIDNGGTDDWDGFFTGFIGNITETMGKPPIFIDTAFEHGHGCRDSTSQKFAYQTNDADSCYSRSLIDVHKRLEELAVFLGVDLEGSDSFSDGQQDMCEAAARFSNAAQAAHNRGIRVALAWFNILPDSVYVAPFSPLADTFARTLEELGMPIVHAGLCTNKPCNSGLYGPDYEIINASTWFVECTEGQAFTSCNGRTLYNIDLWMLGGRELQSVINGRDFFATNFPDRAILAGQYVDIPMNDGTISYHNIARFLDNMAEQLENAQPMYGSSKDCASVDVSSKEHLRASNLIDFSSVPPGQIACYNKAFHQTAYLMCPPKKGVIAVLASVQPLAPLDQQSVLG